MNRGADTLNSSVRSFALVRTCSTRFGSWNGRPLRKRSLISEKIALFNPIPSARVTTASKLNPGDFTSWRRAKRRSVIIIEQRSNRGFPKKNHRGNGGPQAVDRRKTSNENKISDGR